MARSLEDRLKSIGKKQFVNNFNLFKNSTVAICEKELIRKGVDKSEDGSSTRCSNAKFIFKENLQCEALKNIIHSQVSLETKKEAENLLKKENCY